MSEFKATENFYDYGIHKTNMVKGRLSGPCSQRTEIARGSYKN